ncbi:MAG: hypothetical protein IVW57_08710 [Ktedonobacterales bacterium]|nr:hypothetical protein [Ktedonobacterales bacterium]
MSSDVTHDALRAGAVSGAVLLGVGAIQALGVVTGQLHGPLGVLLTLLIWPGVVLAMVPPLLLGRTLGRLGKGEGAKAAGALAGLIAGLAYLLASLLLLLAIQQQPLSSNPGLLPALALPPFVLLLLVTCLAGALITVGGTEIAHSQRSSA